MEEINTQIKLEYSKNKVNITKDEIIKYFKTVLKKEPQQMIFLFIKEIVVYNDKIEVYCNYTNRKNPDDSNHQDFCFYTDNVIFPYCDAKTSLSLEKEMQLSLYLRV